MTPTAPTPAALVVRPAGQEPARVAVQGGDVRWVGTLDDAPGVIAQVEASGVRWIWWSAASVAEVTAQAGLRLARAWDVAEAHRLLTGTWRADPPLAWAGAHELPPELRPGAEQRRSPRAAHYSGDLFTDALPDQLIQPDGYLHPEPYPWAHTDERLLEVADATIACARAQRALAQRESPRLVGTVRAESAAAMLCVELGQDGLPVDEDALRAHVTALGTSTAERDAEVLRHVPGREHVTLRNPEHVRDLLRSVGIQTTSTRKHVLEQFADAHPVVPALLRWRHDERLITTYGLRWLEENVHGGRLRGEWTACDGAAGRMTATAGLHNLPSELRHGVRAEPGFTLVRADLGQVEPRVLAVVAGDRAFAQATAEDDLYMPVAQQLRLERAEAKIAVLAAMYGQRSGSAGQALQRLERAYPVAMRCLDAAYDAGAAGESVRTWGGRPVHTWDGQGALNPEQAGSRGRYARNAVIQGSAAELFKAWAATVRAGLAAQGSRAHIALCLHDELVLHTPEGEADAVVAGLHQALADASRRWSGGAQVRFVADITVAPRWSDTKPATPAPDPPTSPGA